MALFTIMDAGKKRNLCGRKSTRVLNIPPGKYCWYQCYQIFQPSAAVHRKNFLFYPKKENRNSQCFLFSGQTLKIWQKFHPVEKRKFKYSKWESS